MRFGVLGALQVWRADGEPVRVPEAKVRVLLAALLVREGRPVAPERLIDELWGGELPANPHRVLRAKLSQLRGVLATAEEGGRGRVHHGPAGYRLRVDPDEVDAGRFRDLIERARRASEPRTAAPLYARALALWRGPAYADFAEDSFAVGAATRLAEERLTAVEEWAETRLELGEHRLLADELATLVERHPLRERLLAVLMRALYRSGRQAEALNAFELLRRRLGEELGADPAPETAALHQRILRQVPDGEGERGPGMPPRPRTNLPAPISTIVGRDREVSRVRALIDSERLVTLTGPGGVGKTRLALEAASGLVDGGHGGVWLVELGALGATVGAVPSERVAEAVAAALGVRDDTSERTGGGPVARLTEALRDTTGLLVLDNCEHVVESVMELVHTLLGTVEGLRCLVTSREPLGVTGERVYEVTPLRVPDTEIRPDDGNELPSAVRLFTDRAAAAAPGFRLDARTAPAVTAICRRLDGLPLALELAANRVRALGVAELADRLDDRFAVLADGGRAAPRRQQTLRAVFDWSWDLLSDAERAVLRRLSTHAEGCTLAAAEEVCADSTVQKDEVIGPLSRLVECSLVIAVETTDGMRYRLLGSVGAYAAERLEEAGEAGPVRERHMRYYADLVERADGFLRGHEQRGWLRRLDLESANLRVAFDTAVRTGDADTALRLAVAPFWYRYLRGRLGEAHDLLTRATAVGGGSPEAVAAASAWRAAIELLVAAPEDPAAVASAGLAGFGSGRGEVERARVGWFLGSVLLEFGEVAAAGRLVEEALPVLRSRGDQWATAAALNARAWIAQAEGRLARFEDDARRALELFRELGDRWGQLQAMPVLSQRAKAVGDYDAALRVEREGLRMAEDLGLWTEVSYRLSELGRLSLLNGDHRGAEEFHSRAADLAREQGDRFGERFAELGLAMGDRREGRLDRAATRLGDWLARHRDSQGPSALALVLAELGFVAEQRGDADEALRVHTEGLAAARATGSPLAVALALEGLAGAWTLAGAADRGARLLGAATAARESVGVPLPPAERGDVDRVSAAARAALGDSGFAAETRSGRAAGPEGVDAP
ncbi:BTAD domain-containing putative transcriptional regulator [Halostreptopolyspora alba]|uniref:Helix-turn-helix domain-containing protein n=1 Tax=Halostreptopolyspora alba TaxID=2487137 RepID=A0A3N0EI87_9ACTN|nr:helix-turn-helix domain-containing protein [Nocardiopsaceae bacterium YIM 96095]